MLIPLIAMILVAAGVVTYLIMQANRKNKGQRQSPLTAFCICPYRAVSILGHLWNHASP